MREWLRETLMRRRSKRGPNESESTGKIGQEIAANQPAPLRPSYPEPLPTAPAEAKAPAPPSAPTPAPAEPAAQPPAHDAVQLVAERAAEPSSEPKLVHETQPESLGTPPSGPEA